MSPRNTGSGALGELFRKDRSHTVIFVVLAGLVLVASPFLDYYNTTAVRDAAIFGLFALSLDYFWGKTGQLSFGHAVFFGVGAYAYALVAPGLGGTAGSLAGLGAAVALPVVVACVIGYFLLFAGIRGDFFTIVTLALGVIAQQLAISWVAVTGGDAGLVGVPPLTLGGVVFYSPTSSLYLALGALVLLYFVVAMLSAGHTGKVLTAIQCNETRAQSLGYDTSAELLKALMLSAGIAGLAGALYAATSGIVVPDLVGLLLSTEVIMWVVVGGRGTLVGPVVGTFLVMRFQQEISSVSAALWPLVVGVGFVILVFTAPNGLLPWLGRLGRRLTGGRMS
ncbi:MAG: branched-chain amino acid ABC transporter permease [Roseovarius sp.]|uniref:branched-chain amino acid ABC transporter permease n=1 Tax=Roseovarius sp. TaxID=1486281 RepID=UPI0032ED97E8